MMVLASCDGKLTAWSTILVSASSWVLKSSFIVNHLEGWMEAAREMVLAMYEREAKTCYRKCTAMTQHQGAAVTPSAAEILGNERYDSAVPLNSLPSIDDLLVDEIIFINPLTPPMLALQTPEDQLSRTEPERGRGHGLLISDTSSEPLVKSMKEDVIWVSDAASTKTARMISHECSLCDKAFGTASALNKHLLSHQQDRPHVCPICQRSFKRHDHLNGHMLTHQKRKPFRCLEPGCQKSYCDRYALKRHCASQHGIYLMSAPHPVSTQIYTVPGVWGDGLGGMGVGHGDYHSVFFSPPKPASTSQDKNTNYAEFEAFSNYTALASTTGDGMTSSLREPSGPEAQSLLVSDHWDQAKVLDSETPNKLHAAQSASVNPQWVPSLESELAAVGLSPGSESRLGSLRPQGLERGLDFPVSELQALEEMLSLHPPGHTLSSEDTCTLGPTLSESSSSLPKIRRPTIFMKPKLRLANNNRRPHERPLLQFASSLSVTAPQNAPKSVTDSMMSKSSPEQPIQASQTGEKMRKKRVRKRKGKEVVFLARPFAPPLPALVAAPRCQRTRPRYHISPSQVAMASFNADSAPCQPLKDEKREEDSGQVRETLKASCAVEPDSLSPQIPLSPLVMPVSVPVTDCKEKASGHVDECQAAENGQGSTGTLKRTHRFEFLKTLFIPPPVPPQTSPTPLFKEGAMGGHRCRMAGGYPSQLRSPVYLADHLLNPGFQPPPYTPPPMLSPLRQGTGLYFSTLPMPHPGPYPPSTYTAMLGLYAT
ncbi:hypothetical protein GJAV_G00132370 [Gymnothorax javanicus]|nr:hypothetical protein GJAV_G00132370 [Gymnothorax javanicus]